MQIRYLLATVGGLLPVSIADATGPQSWCGIGTPSEQTAKDLDTLRAAEVSSRRSPWARRQVINIPIHLHGVLDPNADPNSITGDMMAGQFDVMNQAYAPHGIQFTLVTMTMVTDSTLANFNTTAFYEDPEADEYRISYLKACRNGGYDELNIWFYTNLEAGLNGVCSLPDTTSQITNLWRDGCHIVAGTMPGGDRESYNVGFTAVHETGHWLGLLHPWGDTTGDCDGVGDRVDDTPAQSQPVFGCPATPQNSCPGQDGFDNADNYMDYADDTCYGSQKFTLGQEIRMHSSYSLLRSILN